MKPQRGDELVVDVSKTLNQLKPYGKDDDDKQSSEHLTAQPQTFVSPLIMRQFK